MTISNSEGLPNLMRMAALKNVSGRRKVLPGAQFAQEMQPEADYTGTSEMNVEMPMPEAEQDFTPQLYDVRANQVQVPEQPEDQNTELFRKFGQSLASYVQNIGQQQPQEQALPQPVTPETPPIETAQVDMQEGLPPVTASQEVNASLKRPESSPGIWGAISDYFSPKKNEEMREYSKKLSQEAQMLSRGETPERRKQQQALDQEALNKAQMQPWNVAAYGATDAFANKPELVQQFEEYTGIDFTPQVEEITKKYEEVLSNIDKGLLDDTAEYDEQAKQIKQRILNNEATDMDKFYIGLALLMPLVIGGIFGKEAGLGALGGSFKGIADVFEKRIENTRKDQENLSDILKQKSNLGIKRGELQIERMKIPGEVQKLLPKDEFEDLKGMKFVTLTDPQTGEVVGFGPEVLPDLVANLQTANTPKKREELDKTAKKLEEEKAALERANQATSDVIQAALQLKQPGIFAKIVSYALSEDNNGVLKKWVRQNAPQIYVDGRMQNSAVYLDSKIEMIKDAYRRLEQMRAFTNTVANHIGNMAANPQYEGLRPEDVTDQMLILRDRAQQFFVDRAEAQGFLRQPLEDKFGKLNRKLYQSLNAKEERNLIEQDKQKIIQRDRR